MKTDFVEIFQTIRANLQPYSTNGFTARINSEEAYELWCEKALDVNGNALEPSLFASVKIEDDAVAFYLIPIEKEPEVKQVIHQDLIKLLTNASRFEFKQLDDALIEQIAEALVAGYTSYKQKGVGLNPLWQEDVTLTVQDLFHQALIIESQPYFLISVNEKLVLHLITLSNNFSPQELINLQATFADEGKQLVQLWEDVWLSKRSQVLSRIKSFAGSNQSFHGRKGKLVEVDLKETKNFLNVNHLQGYVKSKYNFGLVNGDQLIAMACFSATRPMPSKGKDYQSAELVRFASVPGITVVGGLSKLIKHFLKQISVNDLMTYADRDWSLGKGYQNLGFELTTVTEPSFLYLNTSNLTRYFPHRLPKALTEAFETQKDLNLHDFLELNGYVKLFNTGNLKYHFYC